MRNKVIFAIILVAVLGIGGYAYYKTTQKPVVKKVVQLHTVKVAFMSEENLSEALLDLGTSKGFFSDSGLTVTKVPVPTSVSLQLTNGGADFALMQSTAASVEDYYNGKKLKFVEKLTTYPYSIGVVYENSDTSAFTKSAVSKIGAGPQLYSEVMKSNLGILGKVGYAVMASGMPQLNAVSKGTIDYVMANVYSNDYSAEIASLGLKQKSPQEIWKNKLVPGGIVTTEKEISENKTDVQNFVNAVKQTQNYAIKHSGELTDVLVKNQKYSEANAKALVSAYVSSIAPSAKISSSDFAQSLVPVKALDIAYPSLDIAGYFTNDFIK